MTGMLTMLQDLVQHKGFADAALLRAIREHDKAAQDQDLRRLLHHSLLANRFWLMLSRNLLFALDEESKIPESLEELANKYRETHTAELEWVSCIGEADLTRKLETPFLPGCTFSIAQGLMQVCMHSHGHRSQCATRLRLVGGTPPVLDFIVWLKERPAPHWF